VFWIHKKSLTSSTHCLGVVLHVLQGIAAIFAAALIDVDSSSRLFSTRWIFSGDQVVF
jgi:hypothetical protein